VQDADIQTSRDAQGVVDCGVDKAAAVECTRARVAVRKVVAPTPKPESANRLRSATHDVSFLRSDSST